MQNFVKIINGSGGKKQEQRQHREKQMKEKSFKNMFQSKVISLIYQHRLELILKM